MAAFSLKTSSKHWIARNLAALVVPRRLLKCGSCGFARFRLNGQPAQVLAIYRRINRTSRSSTLPHPMASNSHTSKDVVKTCPDNPHPQRVPIPSYISKGDTLTQSLHCAPSGTARRAGNDSDSGCPVAPSAAGGEMRARGCRHGPKIKPQILSRGSARGFRTGGSARGP